MKIGSIFSGITIFYPVILMIGVTISLWIAPLVFTSDPDRITSLPGFSGSLPSRMWSGFIPVAGKSKFLHYWFIESESSPSEDPILLWMQGGPGSSGMLGLLTEMGPFSTNDNSFNKKDNTSVPSIFENPWAWTKAANMIFFESPAAVGFSYCTDVCPQSNDTSTADENYEFVINFFKKFPTYRKNKFYITGESYGGIYVPMLADRVNNDTSINFGGIAVGDGCTGIQTRGGCGIDYNYWYLKVLYGHGQISASLAENLFANCTAWLTGQPNTNSVECSDLYGEVNKQAGAFNIYNLYDECYGKHDELLSMDTSFSMAHQQTQIHQLASGVPSSVGGALNDYPCGAQRAMQAWLQNPLVKKALHVDVPGVHREFSYLSTENSTFPIYHRLLANKKRVLIYYGDTDVIVPYNGGEYWVNNMGLNIIEDWRSWSLHGGSRTGGHLIRFENDFTYLTVRGAGHMVPTFKPEAAFVMIMTFLNGKAYPRDKSDNTASDKSIMDALRRKAKIGEF
ncbi:putative Serine carboxypeptidase 1 [Cardiosporidium cionae]|uniref:Carboxypeptidase n=1 Tax=Cardiosporidium cionae TaxID=476202 RepID=A0ABQ7JGD6_9APIC|nr:putative Serine carboxypeptidase 1 [Cardiosporidium cionae]|eukprot:KAF8823071.1 putative Serine carboxypeptidase 1 [Cardiosporidium cionae]